MKTILIVDDELANAEVLSMILTDEGYQVFCAPNGREGLARVADVKPDLILLDMMMPVMDGAEMGKALRADASSRPIKIIMNSSLNEQLVHAQFSDYDVFLRKPYGIDALLVLVKRLLNEKEHRAE